MIFRVFARLFAASVSLLLGLLMLEAAFRILDNQPLTRAALVMGAEAPDGRSAARTHVATKYIDAVPLAAAMDRAWFDEEPESRPKRRLEPDLAARAAKYPDPITPFFEFNRHYLQQQLCAAGGAHPLQAIDEHFYFEPATTSPYPTYRHLRHVSPPGWFVTNNFGWRGPDVALNRPDGVIRIAFVGASTTVDAFSVPFSHPELVEHWLNRRAIAAGHTYRVEVINAGRTGIDSKSIAAIVTTEVVPTDPDVILFYEGANQFWPGQVMDYQWGRLFPKPPATFRQRTTAEQYSAVVRRSLSAWDRLRGRDGGEPLKPPAQVTWPEGVDEARPDPGHPRLPMDLPQVLRDLATMHAAVTPQGGELVVSSFVWLAYEGLRLDLRRHANIYRYLNDTLWPIPYAHVRRMADFQNRVFAAYAREINVPFVDLASEFPMDPDLFDDPIHLSYDGLRLQGWIYAQHLARMIDMRVSAGRWPRHPASPRDRHPAFSSSDRRLVRVADVARACS